jgi:hypothetical protein
MDTSAALATVTAYCTEQEAGFPYHAGRLLAYAQDTAMVERVAACQAVGSDDFDESDLASPEECLRQVIMYLENQGDKFHPHSDELRALLAS